MKRKKSKNLSLSNFFSYFYEFVNVYFRIESDKMSSYKIFNSKIKFKSDMKFENYPLLYQISFEYLPFLKKYFTKNLVKSFISKNCSFFVFPILFVKKSGKNGDSI